jgi:hypothetical protein
MPTTNGHAVEVGLVLDGHYGWHNHARMIAEAVGLGYEVSDADQAIIDRYDTGDYSGDDAMDEAERVTDLMDEAERWLNEHTPAECINCGQPVEWRPSGWYIHAGIRGQCSLRMSDTAQGYVWHWSDGEFFLSPMCDNDDCDDETCAHWSES